MGEADTIAVVKRVALWQRLTGLLPPDMRPPATGVDAAVSSPGNWNRGLDGYKGNSRLGCGNHHPGGEHPSPWFQLVVRILEGD